MENAIINTMEVLETKPLSELVAEATIKVCYVSPNPNRNNTVITSEVGKEIAASLPGAPVVGFFNKETGDFEEHSRKITIQDGQLAVEELTKPYGFVDPYESPWYQDFEEEGEIRTYLMCKAYFWIRQYAEAALALDKGQSMELDEESMEGYFEGDVFIFTSATTDKLCILGDAYEPCFSGAGIISNYVKQYESLAENLERTLGRRYYVMDNQLITKPEEGQVTDSPKAPFALSYAIELGWNLEEAVYRQLTERGLEKEFSIFGLYVDAGTTFAILNSFASGKFFRCEISITAEDTVDLGLEMTPVIQTWAPVKSEEDPELLIVRYTQDPTPSETPEETPAVDFSLELAEKDQEIESLKESLASYRAAEEAQLKVQKSALIDSYSQVLSEEEMKPVVDKVTDYSLETLEEKFAVLFARKARNAAGGQFQVNINGLSSEEDSDLPDFMKQAIEYDKSREIRL